MIKLLRLGLSELGEEEVVLLVRCLLKHRIGSMSWYDSSYPGKLAGLCSSSAGEQLKRVRGTSGKKTAWRKDCDASGVKSFYDAGVRL